MTPSGMTLLGAGKKATDLVWVDAYGPHAGNLDGGGITGLTIRQVFTAGLLSNTGLTNIRATVYSSSIKALTISKLYIQAAGAGDAYDFSTTPLQFLFSGGAGFALAANSNIVTDTLAFSIPAASNLVCAMFISGDATHDGIRGQSGLATGNRGYFKAGDDATTVDATGYTALTDGVAQPILRIETQ